MRPEKSGLEVEQEDLFRSRLSSILDHSHPLYVLAEAIDWETLEREFGAFYVENLVRRGLATRMMVGMWTQLEKIPARFLFALFAKAWRLVIGEILNSDRHSAHHTSRHRVYADLELAVFKDG